MIGDVAEAHNKTLACVRCGGWNATWSSKFLGVDIEHDGDLAQWCPDCSMVFDVMMSAVDVEVRMSPDDADWSLRPEWWHVSSEGWDTRCPDDVYVHLGRKEVSEWLWRVRQGTVDEIKNPVLYKVRVAGRTPRRLIRDKGEGWYNRRAAYVQEYEVPGAVCLYVPKADVEIVEKTVLY